MIDKPRLPLKVEIPIPSEIPRARGIHSTEKFGTKMKVRYSVDEEMLVKEQAKRIGVGTSQFIRWASVHLAKALMQYKV